MPSKKYFPVEQPSLAWDAPGLMAGVDEAGRATLRLGDDREARGVGAGRGQEDHLIGLGLEDHGGSD